MSPSPDIVDLASCLYPVLRTIAARPALSHSSNISYSALCSQLRGRWQGLHYRDPRLNSALGYLVKRCRAAGLPAISSVVINYGFGHPCNAYFGVAQPEAGDEEALRLTAWAKECTAAHSTKYPKVVP